MNNQYRETIDQLAVPRYAPIINPLPIPESGALDAPLFCLKVNADWIGYIVGMLDALDQPDAWNGNNEEIEAARQNVIKIKAAFGTCEDNALEFRINACDLEWRENDISSWVSLGNVCGADGADGADGEDGTSGTNGADGAPGATGATGATGAKGSCCGTDDVEAPEIPTDPDEALNVFCGMATYFVEWHNQKWVDTLQVVDVEVSAANAVTSAIAAIPGIGIILLPFVEAVKAVAALADGAVDTYLAQADTDFLDAVRCDLFCRLKSAGTFNMTIIHDWADWIITNAGLSLGQVVWSTFINTWTDGEILKRIAVGAALPLSNCDELCTDCPTPSGCDISLWQFFDSNSGTTVTKTLTQWEMNSQVRGDGNSYIIIVSPSAADCCSFTFDGFFDIYSPALCGEDPSTVTSGIHQGTGADAPITGILFRRNSPFTIIATVVP